MRSGTLNRRVTLQSRSEAQGSTGEVTWTWADVDTVWAAIEPMAGREYFAAQQMQATTNTRIRMRFRRGVTTKMRVVYTEAGSPTYTRYYAIDAVINPKDRREELQLMCTEKEADGWNV